MTFRLSLHFSESKQSINRACRGKAETRRNCSYSGEPFLVAPRYHTVPERSQHCPKTDLSSPGEIALWYHNALTGMARTITRGSHFVTQLQMNLKHYGSVSQVHPTNLHTHIMPMDSPFFKLPPYFTSQVGLYLQRKNKEHLWRVHGT